MGLFSCSSKDQLQSSQSPLPSLANLGSERVGQFMGEEPSGRGYDEIALDANGQPHNPMINRFKQQQSIFEESIFPAGRFSLRPCCSTWSNRSFRQVRSSSLYKITSNGWPVECLLASRTRWDKEEFLFKKVNPFQIFLSERESSDRNHALAFFMRENGCFPKYCIQ